MTRRAKLLVCLVVAAGAVSLYAIQGRPSVRWTEMVFYLFAILLSSSMKVPMPRSDGTMSVNFPFILLGIVQLSPLQAVLLAVASVLAQSRFRSMKVITFIQILFNVANVTMATVLACLTYTRSLGWVHREVAPALTIAVTVYFLANTIPLALVLGFESGTSPARQWRQEFPWYYPFYVVGAMLAAFANFIGDHYGWLTSMLLVPMVYTVYRAYCAQMAMIRDREQHIVETEALHLRTIEGLAMAIEAKDRNTHRHLMRVRVYVSQLGKLMGLDDSQMKALVTASFLHDIGKLAVPEHIINKPGKLTPEEFDKMKIHPVVGADILERVRFPYPVVPIVRSHHESWDGSGYPDGLRGEQIPIGARILTAVDCFDALASERPYRRAMPIDEAMAMVKSRAGIQFDPAVVQLLAEHFQELERLANEETGAIAPLNTDFLVTRGEAPGAGFEPERDAHAASGGAARSAGSGLHTAAGRPHLADSSAVAELSRALKAARSVRDAGAILSHRLQPVVPFDCIAVYCRSGAVVLPRYLNGHCECAFSSQPIPLGEGLSGWVAENARCILNGNPTVEPNFLAAAGLFTAESSALSVPLFSAGEVVFGTVTVYSHTAAAYGKDHLRTLQEMASEFAAALVRTMGSTDATGDRTWPGAGTGELLADAAAS